MDTPYDLTIASTDSTFEFRAFVDLFNQLSQYLDEPSKICIDLRHPHHFGPSGMVPLVAVIRKYARAGWTIDVCPPEEAIRRTYWESAGWMQAILEEELPAVNSRKTFTPVVYFEDHHVLNESVSKAIDVLSMTSEFPVGILNAIEWTLNEIADNVLVHAQSPGWLQVRARPLQHTVDFVVTDCGVGIPNSLRESYPQLATDADALALATERGVTRNSSIGQGNGLAGTLRIAEAMHSWVNILSGSAMLRQFDDGHMTSLPIDSFPGTVVALSLKTDAPVDIGDALWGYSPPRTFEMSHVTQSGILFILSQEHSVYGNRASGSDLAIKLRNIMNENSEEKVLIDFSGVDITSASFLDEFLAKVIRREGVISFFERVQLINMNPFVRQTLDEVVSQRIKTG